MSWSPGILSDLVLFQRGFDITKAEQKDGSIPVISSSGIQSYHSEAKVKGPGVVIGRKGTLGSTYFTGTDYWPHDTTLWSKDFRGNDPRYVYYFLKTLNLKSFDTGNSNPTLNRNHIHGMEIQIPDHKTQLAISSILVPYDDLIANNARRLELLEQSARLLFEEWFVRLRYPGHESDKIIDGTPIGWERRPLQEFCSRITDGSHSSPVTTESGTPMASVKDMREWDFDMSECRQISEENYVQLVRNDCKPLKGDILIAKDGANLNKHTFLVTNDREMVVLSSIAIIRPSNGVNAEYLMSMLKSREVSARIKRNVSGAAIPRIILKDFKRLPVLMPEPRIQDAWQRTCGPINDLCRSLFRANTKLVKARDLLLPRLMDSRIKV